MRLRFLGYGMLAWALVAPAVAKEVALTAAQQKNLGVATTKAQPVTERPLAVLPAVLRGARNSRFAIVAPFAGTVTEVSALEGQSVASGAHLATVFSRDLLSVQSQLAQTQAQHGAAAAAADRTRTLAAEGIIAGARAQEADARAQALQAQIAEQQNMLRSVRADSKRPGFYSLVATASGRMASIDVEPGSSIGAMANAFAIDKSDKLWADAQLPPELAGQVQPGAPVTIGAVRGKVIASGIVVDTKTRSVLVRAEIPASNGLMAGAAVNLSVFAPAQPGLNIPRASVVRVQGNDTIFVSTATGFRTAPVQVVGQSEESLTVVGELTPGQAVASAGVSSLKALAEN